MIEDYVRRLAVSQLSNNAHFIANLKKVDLQELFREISIINTLITLNIQSPDLISQPYLQYSLTHEVKSNTDYLQIWSDLGYCPENVYMGYVIFPQEMNYSKLKDYHPADQEVNIWAGIEYFIKWIFHEQLMGLRKTLIYIGFYSELFWEYSAGEHHYYKGKPEYDWYRTPYQLPDKVWV